MRTIYRYDVPVDDLAHDIVLTGEVLATACRSTYFVEFWAEHDPALVPTVRTFQVFGTGHELPPQARYVGTALAPDGGLVWHLFELLVGDAS